MDLRAVIFKRLPLVVFTGLYLVTCYLGALVLLFGPEDVWIWYRHFSGASLPDLYTEHLVRLLILLHLPPILMWAGYEIAMWTTTARFPARFPISLGQLPSGELPGKLVVLSYAFSCLLAFFSLWRAGAPGNITAWTNYNEFIYARRQLFDTLSFFEFGNLYTILPILTALAVLNRLQSPGNRFQRYGVSVVLLGVMFVSQVMTYQKKGLVISGLLVAGAVFLHQFAGKAPRAMIDINRLVGRMSVVMLVLYGVYIGSVMLPVLSPNSKPYEEVAPASSSATQTPPQPPVRDPVIRFDSTVKVEGYSRTKSLFLYALFAPLTRTSAPAIWYPVTYPEQHAFYPLDLGQDILGFGVMPDDNSVIFKAMWPEFANGAIASPYQFALYSQGGLAVALLGSFVIGLVLGGMWFVASAGERPTADRSVLGGLVILFAVYLSLDAVRNAVTVSYGIVWPIALIVGLRLLSPIILPVKMG